ncbi:MAG: CheR family methyltransferase [Polyangiales bacterium]
MPDSDAETYARLGAWIKRQLGIVFAPDQKAQFSERLRRFTTSKGIAPAALLAALERGDPGLTCELAEVMSTNYTFFLREVETFEFLRKHVLPFLPSEEVRLWSAATSSGDEAYTLAMYCLEQFGPQARERIKILGTDLSQKQIQLAEAGRYPQEQLSLVDNTRRALWFTPVEQGRQYEVKPALRELCTFRRLNLTQLPWPFEQRFHVIMLRNVLYYMERPMCVRILESCYDAAAQGAWLFTSITEPMFDLETRWKRVAPAIYRRKGA